LKHYILNLWFLNINRSMGVLKGGTNHAITLKIWQNHASRLDIWIFHVSRLSAWIDYHLLSGTSWCQLYMWKTLLWHLYDIMCSFIVVFCCLVIWQFLIASRLWLISPIILRFECCWLYMSGMYRSLFLSIWIH
jgi:hypothetical protein